MTTDPKTPKVAPIVRDYEVISRDVLNWDLIDSIVETERNLPDVMDYNAEYREAIWAQYPPDDDRFHNRYWWGLKGQQLLEHYKNTEHYKNFSAANKDGYFVPRSGNEPPVENYAFAFVKCLTVRPEIRSWLPVEMDLTARKFFEGSPEGVAAHRKYGDKAGLGKEYWLGKYRFMQYRGYLNLRYAPHVLPIFPNRTEGDEYRKDRNTISSAVGLFLYANDLDAADDRDCLFDILKYLPARDYLIGTYFPEQYEQFFGDKS